MEFYFFYLGFFSFQAIDRFFMRHGATHILGGDVCNGIICAIRQDHSEDSLIIIIICNLRDLPFTWWFTIITMDLFRVSLFYLCI
jgi:hypothetical protein